MFLSLSAAVAQIFILIMIKEFGALLFATVMTTRQFFSILLSCLLFMHPLSSGQWMGTLLVFASLYFKTFAAALQSSRHSYQSAQQDEDTCAPTKASEGHHAMRQPDDEESPAKPKARHT
jgi:adenosine 3'-phospho 5'-phosphosulfate transporter B2